MTPSKRKGARRMSEIPASILTQINQGAIETANLVECLALDFVCLLQTSFPSLKEEALHTMREAAGLGWLARTKLAAQLLYEVYGLNLLPTLLSHPADNVRGWGAGIIAQAPQLTLEERLTLVQPLADDTHAGVREVAWLFLRPLIAKDIAHSIECLIPWTTHPSANIRRFACEITRPRGVWCAHIPTLLTNPSLGLPLLEPLHQDEARYVQHSVANWLNDAAKTQPTWVVELTRTWLDLSPTKATHYICKRAVRSIKQ